MNNSMVWLSSQTSAILNTQRKISQDGMQPNERQCHTTQTRHPYCPSVSAVWPLLLFLVSLRSEYVTGFQSHSMITSFHSYRHIGIANGKSGVQSEIVNSQRVSAPTQRVLIGPITRYGRKRLKTIPLFMIDPTQTQVTTTTTTPSSSSTSSPTPEEEKELDNVYQKAIVNTFGTIAFSSLFGVAIWHYMGAIPSQEFFAGYLIEQSLSLDNLFVFLLLFEYFQVPLEYQNRVLNWGIIGAVLMRGIMISLGSVAVKNFHAVLLLFAAVLVYSSGKMIATLASEGGDDGDDSDDMSGNTIVKFSKSLFPTTDSFDGDKFFSVVDGVKTATPLLLCLVAVEISDVIFAVDSVPAVFGITEDPFIVFTSNICAILGLRSLYIILSKAASDLKYLEPAVAVVLGFIGAKLILEYFGIIIPTELSLLTVASLLSVGVGASILFPENTDTDNTAVDTDTDTDINGQD